MSQSITLRFKQKTKKLGLRSKLTWEDLSYLIASHFDIKGKILGLKDTSDNFFKLSDFCNHHNLKRDEVYHIIVDQGEIKQAVTQNNLYQQSPSQQVQNEQQNKKPSVDKELLSNMVIIVNTFKLWEENFVNSQDERTNLIAVISDKKKGEQDQASANWVTVMNALVQNYGDRADYFCCSIKNREEVPSLRVFPSIVVYKGGQKVMEISLMNQIQTINRLLDRFLNSLTSQSSQGGAHPSAFLMMEESVQPTEYDVGDIVTIPGNIPNQHELIDILQNLQANGSISTMEFLLLKCKVLEQFDLFLQSYFQQFSEFDVASFKDFVMEQSRQLAQPQDYKQQILATNQIEDSGVRKIANRQPIINQMSTEKHGLFSQEQLIKVVIDLETDHLLEMPVLTQVKRLILAENQEIITIIEGYLSHSFNKYYLSEQLMRAITDTNHQERPTSPWPKLDKIMQMFNRIVSKNLLSNNEVEILSTLIQQKDQQLMGTFSDGRIEAELVKSLKRIAMQFIQQEKEITQQFKGSNEFASQKKEDDENLFGNLNNMIYQDTLDKQCFNKKLDFQEHQSSQPHFLSEEAQNSPINYVNQDNNQNNGVNTQKISNDVNKQLSDKNNIENIVQSEDNKLGNNTDQKDKAGSPEINENKRVEYFLKSDNQQNLIDSSVSSLSPLDLMDEYIDQFAPEEYGMAMHLVNQKNEDILQLFEEICHLDENSEVSKITMPIKLIVSSRLREAMQKCFTSEELNIIDSNKTKNTTSIFAVYQQFRVECDYDLFVKNLKQVVSKDTQMTFSNNDSFDDGSSNSQTGNKLQKSLQEILQDNNIISPINSSLTMNQQQNQQINPRYQIDNNQPSFSNQQNKYILQAQEVDRNTKPTQNNNYLSNQSSNNNNLPVSQTENNPANSAIKEHWKQSGLINLHNASSEREITGPTNSNQNDVLETSVRKRLRTESLQVETNPKFSPRQKKTASPARVDPVESDKQNSQREGQSHFGLINLKKLQQIDVKVENTGQTVQDNDLNEILSSEINEFYCSYIYNENDRIFDEIVNLSTNSSNPLTKKVFETFSILYQVNDLDVIDIIEDYKKDRNLVETKLRLTNMAQNKKRSSYSSINSVNNKIGKFNLFKKLLKQIENFYHSEKVDFQVQQYLFLHDDVVTLAVFESYCINKNWKEFVENLVLIEKMSLIKFNLNKTEISKLNSSVLDQLKVIYQYGRFLRSEQKKDLETAIKQGSDHILQLVAQYDREEIESQDLIDGITQYSQDIAKSLRKEEYMWLQKYSCPSIEEREELKKIVEAFREDLKEKDVTSLDIFFKLIEQANNSLLSALALFDYMKDKEDFLENLAMVFHNEVSNEMKRLIREFGRTYKWSQQQVKLLEQKVDDDEPALMAAYFYYKRNENDKEEKQELKETFEIFLAISERQSKKN